MNLTTTTTPPPTNDRGRSARSPWQVPASGWKEIALRTWNEATKDNIGLVAAGVAFYAFLAIVPLLGATVLTYGLIANPQTVIANMQSLAQVLPQDAARLVGEQLMNVVHVSGGKKGFGVVMALALALFGARNAAGSIIIALNIAYEEKEKRGFFKVTLLALAITAVAVVMAMVAMTAVALIGYIGRLLPNAPIVALLFGKVATPVLLAVGAAGAAATLYRYGPSREAARWSWLTPGSVFSAVGWLIVTAGFGFYVTRFANYKATYGSLGAVVGLLTWIYLSSYVFLFGAELNSEIEHQTVHDTTRGEARPLGTRGAWSADHVADGPADDATEGGASALSVEAASDDEAGHPADGPSRLLPAEPADAGHPYLVARAASRVGSFAGLRKVGMISSILSTAGLSLLRKKGRAGAGVALLGAAAGLALLGREKD